MRLFSGILLLTLPLGLLAESADMELAASIMRDHYGTKFNAEQKCWIYQSKEWGPYCMAPIKVQRVSARDGARLYVLAEGRPMSSDGKISELGVHAAPGVVGAFALNIASAAKPRYLAAAKELHFGSFGAAGAGDAKFLRIGLPDLYGWAFASGGTWMGTTVTWHHIVAPRGRRFVDMSDIPEMPEQDQDYTYEIAFDATQPNQAVFPLIVTKRFTGQGETHSPPIVIRVPFNTKTWRYQLR